jgi:hypothetical protein
METWGLKCQIPSVFAQIFFPFYTLFCYNKILHWLTIDHRNLFLTILEKSKIKGPADLVSGEEQQVRNYRPGQKAANYISRLAFHLASCPLLPKISSSSTLEGKGKEGNFSCRFGLASYRRTSQGQGQK